MPVARATLHRPGRARTPTAGSPRGGGRSPRAAPTPGWPGRCSTARPGRRRPGRRGGRPARRGRAAGPGDDLVAALAAAARGVDPAPPPAGAPRYAGCGPPCRPAAPGAARRRGGGLPRRSRRRAVVALAYPERVARLRRRAAGVPDGRRHRRRLAAGSALTGAGWLAVAVADRPPARRGADPAAPRRSTRRPPGRPRRRCWHEARRSAGPTATCVARRVPGSARSCWSSGRWPTRRALVAAALRDGLRREGLGAAALDRRRPGRCGSGWRSCTARSATRGRTCPTRRCSTRRRTWLGPELARSRGAARPAPGRRDRRAAPAAALAARRPAGRAGPGAGRVPSGSQIRVDYDDPAQPVLAVKLQEAFGWRPRPASPTAGCRCCCTCSPPPAGRSAVTADLASFWRTGYPQVRAELRGRYPRHPWPRTRERRRPPAAPHHGGAERRPISSHDVGHHDGDVVRCHRPAAPDRSACRRSSGSG